MNKFHARKVWVDGRQFDSKVEADRYLVLKDKQRRGEIYGLECQRKFTVIEAQNVGKKHVREATYIADFVYYERWNGKMVVEDVKGCKEGVAYQLFVIKKKLMLQKYGIWVREV